MVWTEARHQYCRIYHNGDGTAVDCRYMVERQGNGMDKGDMVGHSGIGVQFGICQQSRAVWLLALSARQHTFIIYKDITSGCRGKYDYGADDSCADSNHRSGGIAVLAAMVDMALIGKVMSKDY